MPVHGSVAPQVSGLVQRPRWHLVMDFQQARIGFETGETEAGLTKF